MNKTIFLSIVGMVLLLSLLISSCNEQATQAEENNNPMAAIPVVEEDIARGEYLVGIMGCNDCHSPKKMGANGPEIIPELMLSGYPSDRPVVKFDSKLIPEGFSLFYPDLTAAAGPWGVSFAGNITPDESGIGNWTADQFKTALVKGKYKGMENGRMLLPPMPWINYASLTNEDLHAMFTYLKSIPPVVNVVPAPVTPDKM